MLPKQDQRLRDAVRKYFPVHVDKSVTSSSSSSSSSRSSEQIQRIEPDSASESTPTDTALPLSKTADIEVSSFSRFPPKVYRDLNGHALPPPVDEIVIVTTGEIEKSAETAEEVAMILGESKVQDLLHSINIVHLYAKVVAHFYCLHLVEDDLSSTINFSNFLTTFILTFRIK